LLPLVDVGSVDAERGARVGEHQTADAARVAQGEMEGLVPAERQSDHVDAVERQPVEQADHSAGDGGEREVVERGRVAVARHVPRDATVVIGERFQLRLPREPRSTQAVQEQHGRPGTRLAIGDRSSQDVTRGHADHVARRRGAHGSRRRPIVDAASDRRASDRRDQFVLNQST
jgi:hypothetical protein